MKAKLLSGMVLLSLLCITGFVYGQRNNPMLSVVSNTYSNEAINVFDLRSKDPINTTYWLDEWRGGEVETKGGGKLTGYMLKYDVVNHNIDLKYNDSVKVVPGSLLKGFTLYDKGEKRKFIDLNIYMKTKDFQLGFFELIQEGNYSLLAKMETELLRANYVATHDAGRTKDTFIKKLAYFTLKNGEVVRLPKKKKEAFIFFDKLKPGATQYMKANKLKTKNRSDLLKLFMYLNS